MPGDRKRRVYDLLVGRDCPECGRVIDAGSLRYEGWAWTHRSDHPQGGHHAFDAFEAMGVDPRPPGFVPVALHREVGDGDLVLLCEVTIPDPNCEVCGGVIDEAHLTHDGHPEGVNLVVCSACKDGTGDEGGETDT